MLSSAAERKIHTILEHADIDFEEEYIFEDLKAPNGKYLRFDFAIFDDNGNLLCLLEFNGKQHYISVPKFGGPQGLSRQKYNDNLKRQYCLRNNLRLITIPYTEENKISYDYLLKLIYT